MVITHVPRPDEDTQVPLLTLDPGLVLFDLDGVLMDTLPVMSSAWEEVCARHGIDVPFSSYVQHLGRPFSDILSILGVPNAQEVSRTYDTASCRDAHLARPFPGIEDALRAIATGNRRLGVVTSKPMERAVPLLERLGIAFAVIRTPVRERGKPAPDTLLSALVEAGTDPGDAVYVGDMAVDQEAARRAGVRYVHAGWGYGDPTDPKPVVVGEPADLVRLLCTAPMTEAA